MSHAHAAALPGLTRERERFANGLPQKQKVEGPHDAGHAFHAKGLVVICRTCGFEYRGNIYHGTNARGVEQATRVEMAKHRADPSWKPSNPGPVNADDPDELRRALV